MKTRSSLAAAPPELDRAWQPRVAVRTAWGRDHAAICRVLVAAYLEHQWRRSAAAYLACAALPQQAHVRPLR